MRKSETHLPPLAPPDEPGGLGFFPLLIVIVAVMVGGFIAAFAWGAL